LCATSFCSTGRCEDSMASFRSMIENAKPSASDVGGIVAPEIFAVTSYPTHPQPGQKIVVKARVGSYDSMVPYKIVKVQITSWKSDGKRQTAPMKVEDALQGVYRAELPALKAGEEIFYSVQAWDDWGNTAVEIAPDTPLETLMTDKQDPELNASVDILKVSAAYDATERLKLCLDLRDKAKRVIGKDPGVYGLFVFSNDVRYKPHLTESEIGNAWLAAYFPYLGVRDLAPAAELLSAATGGSKKQKRSDFSEKGSQICFTFDPSVVREDYYTGMKIAGVTITASLSPMTMNPMDTTHMIMLYPISHSVKAYALK
jgi:hypothetical protein